MDTVVKFTAKYVIGLVVLVWAYVWWRLPKKLKTEMVVVTIVAGVLALLASRVAGRLYFDPRPFVKSHVTPLLPHAADNGFPSDHALLAMTLTAAVYFYRKKWALAALVCTLAVSLARVLAHVHSPIDILGAWVIGVCAATIAYVGVKKLPWFTTANDKQ